jgi:hypothetical protein
MGLPEYWGEGLTRFGRCVYSFLQLQSVLVRLAPESGA